MKLSDRANAIEPSATFAIKAQAAALAAAGKRVVDLSPGEPDGLPPKGVVEAIQEAAADHQHGYGPVAGVPALREAIAARYARERGLTVSAANVMVTHGGKQALDELAKALWNPGDEVIVFAPYWVSYLPQLELVGARAVVVPTRPEDGFQPDPDAVAAAITPRTRGIIINSPSNPSGCVATRDRIEVLMELAARADLTVISDEIYDAITYDGAQATCIPTLSDDARARTIIVHAVSKSFAMTGWRVGWMVGPKDVIQACSGLMGHSTSGVSRLTQAGAIAAVNAPTEGYLPPMIAALQAKRDLLVAGLAGIDGIDVGPVPQGAFYLFPRVDGLFGRRTPGGQVLGSAMDVAGYLIGEGGVATVPGEAFGEGRCVRMSYAVKAEDIRQGIELLAAAVDRLS